MSDDAEKELTPEPIMTKPGRYLKWMVAFLVISGAVAVVLFSGLQSAFLANPGLNGLIVGVFIIGVIIVFRQVIRLSSERFWASSLRSNGSRPRTARTRASPCADRRSCCLRWPPCWARSAAR